MDVAVAVGLVRIVALDFNVEVILKNFTKTKHHFFRFTVVGVFGILLLRRKDELRYFTADAGRGADDPKSALQDRLYEYT